MTRIPDCTLIGASEDLVGLAYPVGRDGVVVGRSLEAVLRLDSDGVSRFHARLEHSNQGVLVLSDLGSSNGTYVNGRRLERPEPLHDGDRVRFGPRASFVVRYGVGGGAETVQVRLRVGGEPDGPRGREVRRRRAIEGAESNSGWRVGGKLRKR